MMQRWNFVERIDKNPNNGLDKDARKNAAHLSAQMLGGEIQPVTKGKTNAIYEDIKPKFY